MTSGRRSSGARRAESRPSRPDGAAHPLAAPALPPHLADWRLPPDWRWGTNALPGEHRHFQEIVDALGRSLSLVTAPDPAHAEWLYHEARHLGHRSHPSIPTTYHYWARVPGAERGPGYLRRWIIGETIGARLARQGPDDVPGVMQLLRDLGSTLAYLHDAGTVHGAVGPESVWTTPTGRTWLLGWQWALSPAERPAGVTPDLSLLPIPPEWDDGAWMPTQASDQWQVAALAFAALTGELPPPSDVPPVRLVRPDCPQSVAALLDRALHETPDERHHSVSAMLRALDRALGGRTGILLEMLHEAETDEQRLRWATGDDYEVLAALGSGTFGSVWRVRDLSLGREVALKMLHPHVARDEALVARFRREARLAAQLAHPAIVPIYDWDTRGDVSWYTMELAEGGSVAELVARAGPRPLEEVAAQLDPLLDGLAAAHAIGIVHRDLKPENIVLDRYRRLRITDFGIANVTGEDRGGASGTPSFAAPEQLLGEAQGPAVDCFSLGAIVLFMLTGELPFGGGDARQILARQLAHDVGLDALPEELEAWLSRALAPEPDRRFADAAEMQTAWREVAERLRRRSRRQSWWGFLGES